MSVDFISRLIGMVALFAGGFYTGSILGKSAGDQPVLWAIIFGLVGALMGLVVTPYLTIRPVRTFRTRVSQVSVRTMVAGLIGLIVGLIIAALVAFPFSLLPSPFSETLPFVGVILFSYLSVSIFVMRQNDIIGLLGNRFGAGLKESPGKAVESQSVLLDTSVIIDGRIADIARTGFISGPMLVPSFVLNELQHIADSSDGLRRQRGRRGLDILNRLQKDSSISFRITDLDVEGVREVDDKLVVLAKQLRGQILTNDYNLNRVAELQGVTVLNINELANAVKAVFLPGETLEVSVIQEGKEAGQGVGYLDDGTMVVIEEGKEYIDTLIPVTVTKVLQTAAGRMIFARPDNSEVDHNLAE
ncbi:MAG: TRAM domain-containing protein [Anaerolineales bacterium]|nr:MAG: TRAM domain-containing protein [Anaerolineales bacterium]